MIEKKPHYNLSEPYAYFRPVFDDLASIEKQETIVQILEDISPRLPRDSNSYDLLTYGYYKAKSYLKAIEWGERALAATTDSKAKAAIRFNLSKCYNYANFPEKAERYLKLNTIYNPEDMDSWVDYSVAIYGTNRKDEAEELLRQSLIRGNFSNPLDAKIVQFNLGTHDIRAGRFRQGMQNLSIGRELRIWGSYTHNFPIPEWTGETHPGAKILIVGEGGIGDELINARFVHHLLERNFRPSWASAHGLRDLLARLPFEGTQNYQNFTSDIPNIRDFDYWTPGMNLPKNLGVDQDELWSGPYLSVSDEYRDKWSWMNQSRKLKIGFRWSGNPKYEQDLHRTIPMEQVWEQVRHLDADFYSLQRDAGSEEVTNYPGMKDLSNDLKTFDDTLAVIDNLDLVITSCTSVAHASAALDRPTLIMIPVMSYYVWSEEKKTSAWYSGRTRLLRQSRQRDWSGPLKELDGYVQMLENNQCWT